MKLIQRIFAASLEAIRPDSLVSNALQRDGNVLTVEGRTFELNENISVVGFGKAVYGMAIGLNGVLHDHIKEGILSVPIGTRSRYKDQMCSKFKVYEGAVNNLPDKPSLKAAMEIKEFVSKLPRDEILFVLISGGGSALLPAPPQGITLSEKLATIKILANAGGSIHQLNTVRKSLSQLKGGKLALLSPSYNIISLIISDIVNDPLDLIASAPTVYDSSSSLDCFEIFEQLDVLHDIPKNVSIFLKKEQMSVNGNDNELEIKKKCINSLIGSNNIALNSAKKMALSSGYKTIILSNKLEGDAAHVGEFLARFALDILANKESDADLFHKLYVDFPTVVNLKALLEIESLKKLCLIFGGETTVKVKGSGRGGRNQHLVLSALKYLLQNSSNIDLSGLVLLSAGTDGQDGPTDAAGAWLDSELCGHMRNVCSINTVINFLDNSGSYDFFDSHDFRRNYLLKTGLTGTNVMDIQILLIDR